jgi:hypothetical protein
VCVPVLLILFTVLLIVAKRCFGKSAKFRGIVQKVEATLFWNTFIRISVVSYLSFCVSANLGAIFSVETESVNKDPKAYVFRLICILIITGSYWFATYTDPIDL